MSMYLLTFKTRYTLFLMDAKELELMVTIY